jgi:hypothetical protein
MRLSLLVSCAWLAGCLSSLGSSADSTVQSASSSAPAAAPACTITVVGGYPVARQCNAAAQAISEFVGCEVDNLNALSQLHGIQPNLPAAQLTWWCQSQHATPLVLDCAADANNPCDQIETFPGLLLYNTANAIQAALDKNLAPPLDTAPDGLPCPNGAGGDLGGVADADGADGPVVNWIVNPLTDGQMLNAFLDGDFDVVNARVPFYRGACTRASTHTIFLAQATLHRNLMNAPDSGCPTPHDRFALDAKGKPSLAMLNQLRAALACPSLPSLAVGAEAERLACQGVIADEQRILHDGQVGLFPASFVFAQLERQFAAFAQLQCSQQFNLSDLNPQVCSPSCANTACGVSGCVGPCGACAASNTACNSAGVCAPSCVPVCAGHQCGPDGCGGFCGRCAAGQACDAAGKCEPVASAPVSFAADVQPILDSRCTGCHSNGALDFDFTPGVAWSKLVNVRSKSCPGRVFVQPGDAQHSYLMDKVLGTLGLCAGSSMRYGSTDSELQTLGDWIDQGAMNN